MSEKNRTAQEVRPDRSFMEALQEFLVTPAGKVATMTSLILAGLVATKDAVADTVACLTKPNGGDYMPSLIVDRLGQVVGDKQTKATEENYFSSGGISSLGDNIYTYASFPSRYDIYDGNLNKGGSVPYPMETGDMGNFIEGTDLRLGIDSNSHTTFLQVDDQNNPTEFVQKGYLEKGSLLHGMTADDEHVFMLTAKDNNIQTAGMLTAILRDGIAGSAKGSAIQPEQVVEIDGMKSGSGGAWFLDGITGQIVFSYQNLSGKFGYTTIDKDQSTWTNGMGAINFRETGVKLLKGCADKINGDRYFLTENNEVIVVDINGMQLNSFPVTPLDISPDVNPLKPLPNGGAVFMEAGSQFITTIDRDGIYVSEDGPTDGYSLNDCTVLPQDPPLDLCPPGGEDDGDECTDDFCDPVTGAVTHTPKAVDDADECTDDDCDPVTGAVAHTPKAVDDANACTNDFCDPVTGLVTHMPKNTDDGDACTLDKCDSVTGAVTHEALPIQSDGDDCTADGCDPSTGNSTHTVTPGVACGENGTCDDDGVCVPPVQPDNNDPDVVEPSPEVIEPDTIDPDTTDPDATPEIGPDTTEVSQDTFELPDEFSELTPEEVAEVLDNLQPDEGTTPPDTANPDTANPDTATPDKGPNDVRPEAVADVLGEQTGADTITPPDTETEVEGKGGGDGCTVGRISTHSKLEAYLALFGLTGLALANRRKKEGARIE